jgi:hypothetical protein
MDRINTAVRAGPSVNDLVTRAGNGDKQAWDTLVERYAPLIWSICRRHRLSSADEVFTQPGVAERVMRLGARAPRYPVPGPNRRELLAAIAD